VTVASPGFNAAPKMGPIRLGLASSHEGLGLKARVSPPDTRFCRLSPVTVETAQSRHRLDQSKQDSHNNEKLDKQRLIQGDAKRHGAAATDKMNSPTFLKHPPLPRTKAGRRYTGPTDPRTASRGPPATPLTDPSKPLLEELLKSVRSRATWIGHIICYGHSSWPLLSLRSFYGLMGSSHRSPTQMVKDRPLLPTLIKSSRIPSPA
jgi:hypothetical protein